MSEAQQPAPAPVPSNPRLYVVDRVEGGVVVLIAEDESGTGAPDDREVRVGALGIPVSEGDVLRVPVLADGAPSWQQAAADPAVRAERLKQAGERLARLKERDPGGDVVL